MKKIWNARKDSEGVSPVIATILMVAITVVLAAILMVMVMGMTDTGTAPTATIVTTGPYGGTGVNVTVSFISVATPRADVNFTVDGVQAVTLMWAGSSLDVVSGATVQVNTTIASPAGTHTVKMIYQGNVIATTTFTVL